MGLSWLNQYKARSNVLAQGHNAVTPVRLHPEALWCGVKHSTTEPLRSLIDEGNTIITDTFHKVWGHKHAK